LAGINAGALITQREPLELRRDQAYIGVMVDDLTSRPFTEPYRMLTARAEFRLTLRSSTAAERLSAVGASYGVVSGVRAARIADDDWSIRQAMATLASVRLRPTAEHDELLARHGEGSVSKPMSGCDLGRRPGMTLARLREVLEAGGMNLGNLVVPRLSSVWRSDSSLPASRSARLAKCGGSARLGCDRS
jgi:tRNA uridine 5-carboxymethylaminomethyl modification enzyme